MNARVVQVVLDEQPLPVGSGSLESVLRITRGRMGQSGQHRNVSVDRLGAVTAGQGKYGNYEIDAARIVDKL